jgi:hypothetical protein
MKSLEGGCECGSIRYRMTAQPTFVNCCHCRQCQKLSGSAFALNAMIERDCVEVVQGADELLVHEGAARCPRCNVLLWATHRFFGDGIRFVRVGTLDEGERLSPDTHFFTRSKHPWVTIPAGVRAFETLPTESDPPLMSGELAARLEAARSG